MIIIDVWFKMSLLLEGNILMMMIKMIQMMIRQTQNQMNHAKKENIKHLSSYY